MRSLVLRLGVLVILSLLAGCSLARPTPVAPTVACPAKITTPAPTSAVEVLDAAFVDSYHQAVADHLLRLREEGPIILNDFLNMTLYLPGDRTARFGMDKNIYFLMARTTHPPLALYSILSMQGFGPLTDTTRQALTNYVELLGRARDEVASAQINENMRQRLTSLLTQSSDYATGVLQDGGARPEAFRTYVQAIRPLVEANLVTGAREQLIQFKAQLDQWKAAYPTERWNALLVVVLGFHQARELYATKLLFQWLLREPVTERRVVYAEVLFPPFGTCRDESQRLALELLAKVDFERDAAGLILGDDTALQRDVMGPAARDVLEDWGASPWP